MCVCVWVCVCCIYKIKLYPVCVLRLYDRIYPFRNHILSIRINARSTGHRPPANPASASGQDRSPPVQRFGATFVMRAHVIRRNAFGRIGF